MPLSLLESNAIDIVGFPLVWIDGLRPAAVSEARHGYLIFARMLSISSLREGAHCLGLDASH